MKHSLDGVYYWTYGDAKNSPLLLIHGFTGSHEGFQYLIPELSKKYFIIAPDLPGFGASALDFKPWTIDALAKRTNAFVRGLQLDQAPVVVSHSMGGLVAARMLSQNPKLFADKTVFISPVATKVKYFDSRKLGAVFGALHYAVGKRTGRAGERLVRSHTVSRVATTMIMTTRDREMRRTIHAHHFKNLEHISSIDFYHQLHKDINRRGVADSASALQKREILIIAAEKDNVTPLRGEKMLAAKLGATLDIIPNVGHLSHYETPDELTRRIAAFLE